MLSPVDVNPDINDSNRASTNARLLELAHDCFSAVLQFDYWSTGAGHQQSAALDQRRRGSTQAGDLPGRQRNDAPTEDIARQYLCEVAARGRLSSSEEYRLARAACDGDPTARQQLIEHQLGLVVMLARPYRNRGLPLLDLIEEGNLGLMQALAKFDPERGCRFSTYAKWWIRQSIELALMTQTRVVHLPVHVSRALKRRNRAAGSEPAPATTPQAQGAPAMLEIGNLLLFEAVDGSSGEQADGELRSLVDSLENEEHERPDSYAHMTCRRRRLSAALDELSGKEKQVIEWRFGLLDDDTLTLECIAERLQLSSERVRQIQVAALTKLRELLSTGSERHHEDLL